MNDLRELIAVPFYVLVVVLYALSACFGLLADAISGSTHSEFLFYT